MGSEVGNEMEAEKSQEEDGESQMEESQENALSNNDGSVQPSVLENVDGEAQETWVTKIELEDIVKNRVALYGNSTCTSAEKEKISKRWKILTKEILYLSDLKCVEGVDRVLLIINEMANSSKVKSVET